MPRRHLCVAGLQVSLAFCLALSPAVAQRPSRPADLKPADQKPTGSLPAGKAPVGAVNAATLRDLLATAASRYAKPEEWRAAGEALLRLLPDLNGRDRLDVLTAVAGIAVRIRAPRAKGRVRQLLQEARASGDRMGVARGLVLKARLLQFDGADEEAVAPLQHAAEIYRAEHEELQAARTLVMLSACVRRCGAVAEAVGFAEQALASARRSGDEYVEATVGNNLAYWLLELGRYRESRDLYESLRGSKMRERTKFAVRVGLAGLDLREGRPVEAREALLVLLGILAEKSEPPRALRGVAKLLVARSFAAQRRWPECREWSAQAVAELRAWPHRLADAEICHARALGQSEKSDERDRGLATLRRVAENQTDPWVRRRALSQYARALASRGRFEEAFGAQKTLAEAQRAQQVRSARVLASALDAKIRTSRKLRDLEIKASDALRARQVADIEASGARSELRRAAAAREREQRGWLLVVVSLVAVFLLSTFWIRSRAQRRLARERLEDQVQLNSLLASKVAEKAKSLRGETRARAELQVLLEKKRRDETVGQLTAGIAHEFNNLLQVIVSSCELLELTPEEAEREALLAKCLAASASGSQITSQLLAYSRTQALTAEPTQVSELLRGVAQLLRSSAGDLVKFELVDLSAGLSILVDPVQLTTALIKLLVNSREACPGGGRITLSVEVSAPPRSRDVVEGSGGDDAAQYLLFKVTDDGVGMSLSELDRACEPFFTSKQVGSGAGLGLSMVSGFVRQSHGVFNIYGEPGRGTTVSLFLPICPAGAPGLDEDEPREPQSVRKRCLLVDDNELIVETMNSRLLAMGFEVVTCTSADVAQGLLEDDWQDFGLLLSDIKMPGQMDGIELARSARARHPDLPIVLMTGYARDVAGPEEFTVLRKPFRDADLRAAIGLSHEASPGGLVS